MKESSAYQQILDEGREGAHRMDVLDVVKARFGKHGATSLKPILKTVHRRAQLRALLKLAASCSNLDELMTAAAK